MKKRHPREVPADIYKLLKYKRIGKDVNTEFLIEQFGEEVKAALRDAVVAPEQVRKGRLRLSAIGKPDRQIYNSYHGIEGKELDGPTRMRFLYGHITEALVLALTQISGHTVTHQQSVCEVEGVKGSTDGKIDGIIMDVKSASSFGFNKFRTGKLLQNDPFGYAAQLLAYAHSEGDREIGWLALDKSKGEICWLGYDLDNLREEDEQYLGIDIAAKVRHIKKMVGLEEPKPCFEPVPEGKSGNMKLQNGCGWCDYREHCWPDAKGFQYSSGVTWLTQVIKMPKVSPIHEDF